MIDGFHWFKVPNIHCVGICLNALLNEAEQCWMDLIGSKFPTITKLDLFERFIE